LRSFAGGNLSSTTSRDFRQCRLFFFFPSDKIISCVYGGIATTNDDQLAQKIATYQEKIGFPPTSWTRQQLRHPLLMNRLILPTYSILGKYLLVLFQQSNVLSKAVHWKEKRGLCPDYFPRRLPGALAVLASHQLENLINIIPIDKKSRKFIFKLCQKFCFQ